MDSHYLNNGENFINESDNDDGLVESPVDNSTSGTLSGRVHTIPVWHKDFRVSKSGNFTSLHRINSVIPMINDLQFIGICLENICY